MRGKIYIRKENNTRSEEEIKMKKYISIGHWKGNKNTTSVASTSRTKKDFREMLGGNEFIPYIILTEDRFNKVIELDTFDLFNEVKKMTSNYRKWDEVTEYINQCWDIMEEKLQRA